MVTVEQLNIFPLKSARGIPVPAVRVAATGLEWDRHWMFINAAGNFLSQRSHPRMAQIQTEISASSLILRIAGADPLELPLAPSGDARPVQVWKDLCEGLDQGERASAWASATLGESIRVVRIPASPRRMASPEFTGPRLAPVSFSDGFPILVCNRASLDDLNRRMREPVPIERFRPNIVLIGLPPFAEDHIASIRMGPVTLDLVKPCTRCIITSTDQSTGERTTNPIPALKEFRFNRALKGVTFGENAIPVAGIGCTIERGTRCEVIYDRDSTSDREAQDPAVISVDWTRAALPTG